MTAAENKAIFLRFIDELGKGNLAIIDEVCSPNFAFHSANWPGWPRGLEGARKLAAFGRTLYRDGVSKIDAVVAEDDKVVVRYTLRATYIGEAKPGFPTPGAKVAVAIMSMYRFVDGKIVDDWGAEVFFPTSISESVIDGWSRGTAA